MDKWPNAPGLGSKSSKSPQALTQPRSQSTLALSKSQLRLLQNRPGLCLTHTQTLEWHAAPPPTPRALPSNAASNAGTRGHGAAMDSRQQDPAPTEVFAIMVGKGREAPAPRPGIQCWQAGVESLTDPGLALGTHQHLHNHHALVRSTPSLGAGRGSSPLENTEKDHHPSSWKFRPPGSSRSKESRTPLCS